MKFCKLQYMHFPDKSESDSDSVQNGLVTCHILSAVEFNEAGSWIVDSGATRHICNNRQTFWNFTVQKGHSMLHQGMIIR